MICPICKYTMIVVEHHKIELDYCTRCHGVWFDSQELELFLNSIGLDSQELFISNILNSPEAKPPGKKQKCPICTRKMKRRSIGQQPAIVIDVCQRGDGLWFDGGEVDCLIQQLADKSPSNQDSEQIFNFVGDIFKAHK